MELEIDMGDASEESSDKKTEQTETTETAAEAPQSTSNATLRQSVVFEGAVPDASAYLFSLPSYTMGKFNLLMQKAAVTPGLDVNTPEMKAWRESQTETMDSYTPGGLYQSRFEDPASSFEQGVLKEDGSLHGIATPKFKQTSGELKGEQAVLHVSRSLGLGDVLTIPLPHSGISVTIKPPTERDIVDFYTTVFREKVFLGRTSSGMTLTNMSAYLNNRLFDFIVKHIHSVNYGDIPKTQLRDYMLLHDYHILAWGFAATMYPKGFDYQRDCSFDLSKCKHKVTGTINMLKLLWIDNAALTQVQKDILCEVRPNKHNLEVYRKYVAEHTRTKSSEVRLTSGMKLVLKVPTFAEHISDGLSWVNGINSSIDNLLMVDSDEATVGKQRQEFLQQYVSSSVLRQFSHFIDYIEDNDSVISDRDTINAVLSLLSSDDLLRKEINEKIVKFISDTTLAVIGVPEYNCPACGNPQKSADTREGLADVIPIDVMLTFFTLVTLRMSRIMARE